MTKPNGATIRYLRRRKGMTLEHLARRAGVSEKTLRSLEKDNTNSPHPETISAIAKALRVDPEALFPSVRIAGNDFSSTDENFESKIQIKSITSEEAKPLAFLILRDDQNRLLSRYRIVEEQTTIGRSVSNTIKLSNALVSENHSIITIIGSRIQVRDLGSTNGTFIKGSRINGRMDIEYGEHVSIGPYVIELVPPGTDPSGFPIHETGVLPRVPGKLER